MLTTTTVTISLPDLLKAFLDRQVATKGYGHVSEYFRSLLREGLASRSLPLDADFRKRLEAKTEALIDKPSAKKR